MGIGKRGQVYSQMFLWDLCLLLTAMLNVFLTHLIHRFSIKKWGRGWNLPFKVVERTTNKVYEVPGTWEISNKCQSVAAAGVQMKADF